jgi:hypothetical protein
MGIQGIDQDLGRLRHSLYYPPILLAKNSWVAVAHSFHLSKS